MAKFDLGDSLANILGSVSPSDTEEQIEYISLQYLVSDERNFYSMDGVEELAANIELIGLQQPLRVLKGDNGFYVIVSGHRRAAALRLLAEDAPEKWDRVPCIVEKPGGSPELEELRLIMANADTRRMSSADLAKQAERVEMLLYQLKEQGVINVTGRMRDRVAEACQVSATKLAELKVIRENLVPVWKTLWEENKIRHSTAYTLAKEDPDVQVKVFDLFKDPTSAYEWGVSDRARRVKQAAAKTCDKCEDGKCSYADRALYNEFVKSGYKVCSQIACCEKCNEFDRCTMVCPLLKDKQKKKKVEQSEEVKLAKQREKEHEEAQIGMVKTVWERFGKARQAAGLGFKETLKKSGATVYDWKNYKEEEARETGEGNWGVSQNVPWGYSRAEDIERILKVADLLGCSTDYLLGRAEEPAPAAAPSKSLQFHTDGPPDHDAVCWCIFDLGDDNVRCDPALWKGGKWRFYGIDADIIAKCIGWIELPDYERKLRK